MAYVLLALECADAVPTESHQVDPTTVADAIRNDDTSTHVFHGPTVEWEPGDRCPYCKSASMTVTQLCRETYDSRNGGFRCERPDPDYGRLVDVWCQECAKLLTANRDSLLEYFDRPRADNERPPNAVDYKPWSHGSRS